MKKITYKTLITLIVISLIAPGLSYAQTKCDIQNHLNNLISIKDNLELKEEEAVKEFNARQALLQEVIKCSLEEIKDIEERLDEIENLKEEEKVIKESFKEDLNSFKAYYEQNQELINSIEEDNQKLKDLAGQILSFRENKYNQKTTNIVNFIFSFKQQKVIDITSERLSKIKTSLEKILSINDEQVTSLLEDSTQKVNEAIKLKNKAYNLIIDTYELSQNPEKDKATTTIETIIETIEEETTEKNTLGKENKESEKNIKIKEEPTNPRDLIKESLNNIKSAYTNFFKISQRIKTLLGL